MDNEHGALGAPADFQGLLSWGCSTGSADGWWKKAVGESRAPRPGGTPASLGLWEGLSATFNRIHCVGAAGECLMPGSSDRGFLFHGNNFMVAKC